MRPSLHLNLNSAARGAAPTLDKTVSDDSNDENIYKTTASNGDIEFHIKSATGFLKLSEYTQGGGEFKPFWKYYLETNINLTSKNNFTPVGSENSIFYGTFDGKNHILTYSQKGFSDVTTLRASLFGMVGACSIQDLDVRCDIDTSDSGATSGYATGLISEIASNGGTCRLQHITMSGTIKGSEKQKTSALIGSVTNTNLFIYDVINLCPGGMIDSLTSTTKNTAKIAMTKIQGVAINSAQNYELTFQRYIGGGALTGSVANCSLLTTSCQLTGNISSFLGKVTGKTTLEAYDIAVISNTSTMPKVCDSGLLFTEYYAGMYLAQGTQVQIVDPNFTSYEWCADPHLQNGLPQLKQFVSTSAFLEQYDIVTWANEIFKQQKNG